jgi:hypothetical protein
MRTRIADLIRDAIDIIAACDDPDCEAWLGQARAELAVMNAKPQLRSALAEVAGPVCMLPLGLPSNPYASTSDVSAAAFSKGLNETGYVEGQNGVSQPALTSCVCEGADKLAAFQSNFQGFLLNPHICLRRAGVHSGGS